MDEFIEKLNDFFRTDGVTLVRSITLVLVGYMLIKAFIGFLKCSLNKSGVKEKTLPNFLISLLNIALTLVLVIYVLTLMGVSSDSVVTIASVFSLGVSLALQDTISSFANGIIIIVSKPFVEGEYVWINEVEGTVISISMFHTTIKTAKGQMITIPNSSATGSNVINYSRLPTRRIDLVIPVSFGSDIEKVKCVVMGVVNKQNGILSDPKPSIRLTKYGTSNLEFTLKAWVSCSIYWDTIFDLNEKILVALRESGLRIDYSQCDVHIKDSRGN